MDERNHYLLREEFVQTDTVLTAAAKTSPPAAVIFLDWFVGIPIQKWVMFVTLVYTSLQIYFLISTQLRKRRSRLRMRKSDV